MIALKLDEFDLKAREFTVEINKSVARKQFYETVPVKLSGGRVFAASASGIW